GRDVRSRSDVGHRHVLPPALNAQADSSPAQCGARLAPLTLPQPFASWTPGFHALYTTQILLKRQYCHIGNYFENVELLCLRPGRAAVNSARTSVLGRLWVNDLVLAGTRKISWPWSILLDT